MPNLTRLRELAEAASKPEPDMYESDGQSQAHEHWYWQEDGVALLRTGFDRSWSWSWSI